MSTVTATSSQGSERTLGIVLVGGSAAIFGLAGVLTKSIHADPLTINCWRGLVGGLLITGYVLWRRRGSDSPSSLALGWRGWLMAVLGALASIAFIAAFKHTYVSNVAIIYATAPFVAALLGWVLLRERVRSMTMAAAALSLCGVGLMVSSGLGSGNMLGDGLALSMTVMAALYMVLIRRFRDTPVVWAGAVSAFMLFALGWVVSDPLAISTMDAILLMAFGCSFAVASVMWTEGSRLIPAAEAGLLGSAEVPFATLFGWLLLSEAPPAATLTGGAIVLAAVLWHAGRDLMAARASGALDGATGAQEK
jgi:drug/metabolite transporter (DMT)-like permease